MTTIARLMIAALIAALAFVAVPATAHADPPVVHDCEVMVFSLIEDNAQAAARSAETFALLRTQNDALTVQLEESRSEHAAALALADRRKVRIYELRQKILKLQRRVTVAGVSR